MITKTKIDWCDYTWNPVWGCEHGCLYCYARSMAKRFARSMSKKEAEFYFKQHPTWAWTGDHLSGLKDFKPTFLLSNFHKQFPKKTSTIFVNSMSDPAYWLDNWTIKIIDKIKVNQQHQFMILTKSPQIYDKYNWPDNCWSGVTITNQAQMNDLNQNLFNTSYSWAQSNYIFLSIEPILENINISFRPDWLIIGAETGNRKNKIIPKKEWILELVKEVYRLYKSPPIFMKESLRAIMGADFIQQFPEELKGRVKL